MLSGVWVNVSNVLYQHHPAQHQQKKRMATNNPQIPVRGGMRNVDGASRNDGHCFTSLTVRHSGNEIWDMYLDEVKEDDKRIADAWKEDSNGILIFVSPNLLIPPFISMTSFKTGLFSATVGAFIIEFYKQLSPNSGNQTVIPLANGTYSIIANPPSPPSASMIWVNAMWLISLVLSLTSALIATLLQQWARRYVEMPDRPSDPNHRARVRSFLFLGTEIYKMRFAVQIAPTLLHLSVYLFFAGLVIVFRTINKTVAIAVEVAVGVFGVAYIALSILPCLDVRCPYRTPMSYFLWYPTHAILSFSAVCLRWLVELLHGCLVEPSLGDPTTPTQRILVRWLESREEAVKTHWRYIKDGIGKSIINSAINAQGGDRRIVTRLFNLLAMGDKSKLRKFAASIPRERGPRSHPPHQVQENCPPRTPPHSPTKLCSRYKRSWTRRGSAQALPSGMFRRYPQHRQGPQCPRFKLRAGQLRKYRSYASMAG